MRAKTIPHVEYEIFQYILDEIDISIVKESLVPSGDEVAADRFDKGAESAAQLIQNLIDRRLHRLPHDHPDFKEREA